MNILINTVASSLVFYPAVSEGKPQEQVPADSPAQIKGSFLTGVSQPEIESVLPIK